MEALPLQPPGSQTPTPPPVPLSLSRLNNLSLPGASSLSLSLFASRDLPTLSQLRYPSFLGTLTCLKIDLNCPACCS